MQSFQKIRTWIFCGCFLVGLTFAEKLQEPIDLEPELPLEEVLSLLDQRAPLPAWQEDVDEEAVTLLLPSESDQDDDVLARIQLEEELSKAEAEMLKLERLQNQPVDLKQYFSAKESLFVRDPQAFLTQRESRQLQDLLISFAGESDYSLHLNIFAKPDIPQINELIENGVIDYLKVNPKSALVFYVHDDPTHSQIMFGEELAAGISLELRAQFRNSAIDEAVLQGDSYQAVYRYLVDYTYHLLDFLDTTKSIDGVGDSMVAIPTGDEVKHPSYLKELVWEVQGAVFESEPKALIAMGVLIIGGVFGLLFYCWNRFFRVYRFPLDTRKASLDFPRSMRSSGILDFSDESPSLKQQEKKLFR